MEDLEPILNILCNYQSGFELRKEEASLLGQWINRSTQHKQLFRDLGNWTKLYMGNIEGNPREAIQNRLIEMK